MHLQHLALQEEERRLVARELHDEIGQHVAAIEMETIRIGRLDAHERTARQERLQVLRGLVAEIHRVSRRLIQRLRPPAIERLGIGGAVQVLFDRWREEHAQITLHAKVELGGQPISDDCAVHLYRIIQESLTNVARHSEAGSVRVLLENRNDRLLLQVSDDGCGFDLQKRASGYGLGGMRERVEALSGSLLLQSRPGGGTTIKVSLPV